MRKPLRWLLTLAMLVGAAGAGGAPAAAAPAGSGGPGTGDVKDRILAVRGMSLIEEIPVEGYRFFVLNYTQPVDHKRPYLGTFQQRLTLLHRGEDRPTVFHTSGYHVSTVPSRSEPARIADGNQVSMEYRFFTPSRPEPANWSKLDIWQAAADQHRVHRALKRIYRGNWLATGGSKGGMTATYYRRFFPHDMDGTVAYVAPNDHRNDEDSAYDRFFETVATPECRDALDTAQREALLRREELTARYQAWAGENDATFATIGGIDRAFESAVLDLAWAFWQYGTESDCADVPAADAPSGELYDFLDTVSGLSFYTDEGLAPYTPYYYQAGTELGAPDVAAPHLEDLLLHPGTYGPRAYVPREIPMEWEDGVMRDVDRWVRHRSERMMFVYGENDPWGAEPFRLGRGSRDSYVFTVPGANHGASITAMNGAEEDTAVAAILRWADVAPDAVRRDASAARPLAERDPALDEPALDERTADRRQLLRP
ncbi:S28 family serine protease [Streptomyces sp. Ru87]|uniref:S28 family serine protease n=1 Tax=Streptomyces sp. Ru87 TaxID=2044307 RepID=UPI000BFA204B|nr:S28 family serine protease [Streptomyces sp. Ru87]PGH50297.1 aminopeptidase [Streptomyces sp. Ru87]